MGKYLKKFENHTDYETYINGLDIILPNVSYCEDNSCVHYNPIVNYPKMYFTVEAVESGDFSLYYDYETFGGTRPHLEYLEYSKDGQNWTRLVPVESEMAYSDSIHLNVGESVMVRGINDSLGFLQWDSYSRSASFTFRNEEETPPTNKKCKVYGNIMSLLYGDNFVDKVVFPNNGLKGIFACFLSYTDVTDASNLILPCNTMVEECYQNMFGGCTSLVNAPKLPATTLANSCYYCMFYGCTSLTTAPELPATTLATSCYASMFSNCTSLTTAPELPATTSESSCYNRMFLNCTSLEIAPILPATTLANSCYSYMFQNCTGLVNAPSVLPATTLKNWCYSDMFSGCKSLETAPELPATTLIYGCYKGMFVGCTNLNYIKCLATNISANNCTESWVGLVSATGTFVKATSMTDWTNGVNGIPNGWTVETANE